MNNILSKIIQHKKQELIKRKKEKPLFEIKKDIKKSDISFLNAIKGKNRVHLIAEIKRASPSKGIIVKDFQLEETISLYNKYASAISVLTDEHFFGGSFYNLQKTRELSHLPLLCKDFIIDEYQIYEARHYGANTILLIAAVLDTHELKGLYKVVQSLNMDVLFEVHDEQELGKVLDVGAKIVGVNNRNLKDFSIDLELTNKLSKKIPDDVILVSESGISCTEDAINIWGTADAMLVGSSIMGDMNPKEKIEELSLIQNSQGDKIYNRSKRSFDKLRMTEKVFQHLPKIKICGITNAEDAIEAIKCGASYIGLIFADESPRKIDIKKAKEIIIDIKTSFKLSKNVVLRQAQDDIRQAQSLSSTQSGNDIRKSSCHTEPVEVSKDSISPSIKFIGVFVNQKDCFQIGKDIGLDGIQLHGEENNKFIKEGKKIFKGEIWKAIGNEQLGMSNDQWRNIDVLLVDNATKEKHGGTGETFNWEESLDKLRMKDIKTLTAIAGGINSNNIQKAREYGAILDIGSGVEEKPGKKDLKKLKELFKNLKS